VKSPTVVVMQLMLTCTVPGLWHVFRYFEKKFETDVVNVALEALIICIFWMSKHSIQPSNRC